jgi:hypothetical protein
MEEVYAVPCDVELNEYKYVSSYKSNTIQHLGLNGMNFDTTVHLRSVNY